MIFNSCTRPRLKAWKRRFDVFHVCKGDVNGFEDPRLVIARLTFIPAACPNIFRGLLPAVAAVKVAEPSPTCLAILSYSFNTFINTGPYSDVLPPALHQFASHAVP